jgi:Family of unknown function (DUF6282)
VNLAERADDPDMSALVEEAIDCYVHGAPDLIARRGNDIELARECAAGGYAAAVHRHHFADTTGRAELARAATGFRLLGALVLNDASGGINPTAAEVALRSGAAWVSLPTLSSAVFRAGLRSKPAAVRGVLGLGPGRLRLLDESGELRPEVRATMELVAEHGAVLGLGYGGADELVAVLRATSPSGPTAVLTYPHIAGLSAAQAGELVTVGDCYLELCAYRLHPSGPAGGGDAPLREALGLLEAVGADRTIMSSDGGIADAPAPSELLAFGLQQLAGAGVKLSVLRRLVSNNPQRLLAGQLT